MPLKSKKNNISINKEEENHKPKDIKTKESNSLFKMPKKLEKTKSTRISKDSNLECLSAAWMTPILNRHLKNKNKKAPNSKNIH